MCILSTIFTMLNVENKNIYINLFVFCFILNISRAICFWIKLLFSRLYLKNTRITCKCTNTMLFIWTCAHWAHVFFNYNLESCNVIYKHIVVILKL